MRFYTNENFPQPVVHHLRHLGHDVLTSLEAGNANQRIPDELVLKFATHENRILLTINRKDFIKLHRIEPMHSGIVVCTIDSDFESLAHRIHLQTAIAIPQESQNIDNQLIRIYRS